MLKSDGLAQTRCSHGGQGLTASVHVLRIPSVGSVWPMPEVLGVEQRHLQAVESLPGSLIWVQLFFTKQEHF